METKSKFRRFLARVGEVNLSRIWNLFRKVFNFSWKAGVVILGISLTAEVLGEVYDWAEDRLGLRHRYWMDYDLANRVEVRHFSRNQCATYDRITDERLSPKVRWISCVPERDSLTVFCDKDGRRGFLNVNTGRVVIDGQYKHAWHFSEGLAAVVADNGKVGFIDYDNRMVIPAEYDYVAGHDYLFINGMCILRDINSGKYGAIDTMGVLRLPMEYSRVFKGYEESTWYLRKDGRCGLADADMNIIFEPIYDNISSHPDEGNAHLILNGVKQLVSFDGEVILPFVIDEAWPLEYQSNTEEGSYTVMHPYLVEVMVDYGYHGVMDSRTGKMVIPAVYTNVNMISKDLLKLEVDGDSENNVVFTTSGVMIKQN